MEGCIINKFRIIRLLGEGGMAKVWLAVHEENNLNVAIKILDHKFYKDDNIKQRFYKEAKELTKLNHPNIVSVFEYIEEGYLVAFIMEYIGNNTLKYHIQNTHLSPLIKFQFIIEMLNAVDYLHNNNIIHRDLKPDNFLVTKNYNLKLTDFGIIKLINQKENQIYFDQTKVGSQMGTPRYKSPEQVKDAKYVEKSSDIYSLGVIVWEIITSQRVYNDITGFDIEIAVVTKPLPLTNTIWDEIIQKATQKNPEKRFNNLKAFIEDVSKLRRKITI